MNREKLFEVLELVGHVEYNKWDAVRTLADLISKGAATVISKEWFQNDHCREGSFDLGKIETWSTYEPHCISLRFTIDEKKLACVANIYNGDNIYGSMESRRFEAVIELPDSLIHDLEYKIESEFDRWLESAHEAYLEAQKLAWIEAKRNEILSK